MIPIERALKQTGVRPEGVRDALSTLAPRQSGEVTFADLSSSLELSPRQIYRSLHVLLELCQADWNRQQFALISRSVFDLIYSPRLWNRRMRDRRSVDSDNLLRVYDAIVRYRYTRAWGVRIWDISRYAAQLVDGEASAFDSGERLLVLPTFLQSTRPDAQTAHPELFDARTRILLLRKIDENPDLEELSAPLLSGFIDPEREFLLETGSLSDGPLAGRLVIGRDHVQREIYDLATAQYYVQVVYQRVFDVMSLEFIDEDFEQPSVYAQNRQVILDLLDEVEERIERKSTGTDDRLERLAEMVNRVREAVLAHEPSVSGHDPDVPAALSLDGITFSDFQRTINEIVDSLHLRQTQVFGISPSSRSWVFWRAIRDIGSYLCANPNKPVRHLFYAQEERALPRWDDFGSSWQKTATTLGYSPESFDADATDGPECVEWLQHVSFDHQGNAPMPVALAIQTAPNTIGLQAPSYPLSALLDSLSRTLQNATNRTSLVHSDSVPPDHRNVLWFNVVRLGDALRRFLSRHPEISRSVVVRFTDSTPTPDVTGNLVMEIFERPPDDSEQIRGYSHLAPPGGTTVRPRHSRVSFNLNGLMEAPHFRDFLNDAGLVGVAWLCYCGNRRHQEVERAAVLFAYSDDPVTGRYDARELEMQEAVRFPANFTLAIPYVVETARVGEELVQWCRLADLSNPVVIRDSQAPFLGDATLR